MKLVAAESAGGESRLAGIEMALLTLRLMEHWRAGSGRNLCGKTDTRRA